MTVLLVVTAVAAERDAVLTGLGTVGAMIDGATVVLEPGSGGVSGSGVHVLIGGVGAAAAAAETARALTARQMAGGSAYDAVLDMGIAGGYAGRASIGDTVVGTRAVAADLGADSPTGFLTMSDLGFGADSVDADGDLVAALVRLLPRAIAGPVLTVQTVTGTAKRATELAERHPDAVAETMEGYGVATAAARHGAGFVELRTVSNLVGPRDRSAWRIGEAMDALTAAARAVATLVG